MYRPQSVSAANYTTILSSNCVFHGAEWAQKLQNYLAKSPATQLYDPLDAVAALQNRQSMLEPLAEAIQLHPLGPDARQGSTAEPDMLSCAAPVQVPLQAGTTC